MIFEGSVNASKSTIPDRQTLRAAFPCLIFKQIKNYSNIAKTAFFMASFVSFAAWALSFFV